MYGQYDSFVRLEFKHDCESFEKYGSSLMGTFKYIETERAKLTETLKHTEIPRTEEAVLFIPSELEKLNDSQVEDLDKNGILCSDIISISVSNLPKSNRYTTQGKKELSNLLNIEIDASDWQDLNRINYGFLKSRYLKDKNLSPKEKSVYFGLRTYFNDNLDADYKDQAFLGLKIKPEIRHQELKAKFFDLRITEDEMLEYIILASEELKEKDAIIKAELTRTTEKLTELATKYGDEIDNLKNICVSYDERVVLFGNKLIYLDFERFVYIYARHVTETLISDKYSGKTVFQYKFDDIMTLISSVLSSISEEIDTHFNATPDNSFGRRGKRSVYYDGHYYRVEIDLNGRLETFHPYNNNEEKDNDDE